VDDKRAYRRSGIVPRCCVWERDYTSSDPSDGSSPRFGIRLNSAACLLGGLFKAQELPVPDRCNGFEFGAEIEISVASPIGVANVAIGHESLATKDRVWPLFEDGKGIWNADHIKGQPT
jgi:hypothetical protein